MLLVGIEVHLHWLPGLGFVLSCSAQYDTLISVFGFACCLLLCSVPGAVFAQLPRALEPMPFWISLLTQHWFTSFPSLCWFTG